jgi:hypothetical protein
MCRLTRQRSPTLVLSMPALAAIGTAVIQVVATTAGNLVFKAEKTASDDWRFFYFLGIQRVVSVFTSCR